jgi:hypothetical protein
VRFVRATAVMLTKLRLEAAVGGNEVSNPFMVAEVYVRHGASWMLEAMSFTRHELRSELGPPRARQTSYSDPLTKYIVRTTSHKKDYVNYLK